VECGAVAILDTLHQLAVHLLGQLNLGHVTPSWRESSPVGGCIGAALTAIKCGRDDTGLPIRIGRPAMAADRTPGSTTTSAAPIIAGLVPGFDGLRFRHWQVEARADGVVVVTIDRDGQAVNALSQAMLVELGELLERLAIDPPRGVVFRSGKS